MKKFAKFTVVFVCILVMLLLSLSFVACNSSGDNGILFNGNPLKDYTIVYDDSDIFAKHAARILHDELMSLANVNLNVVDDNTQTTTFEILIGNTNRDIVNPSLNEFEYMFGVDKNNVVMLGSIYVGGAVSDFLDIVKSANGNVTYNKEVTKYTYQFVDAKSVILMIGDGMGFNTIEMARSEGIFDTFSAEYLPYIGEIITRSYSVMIGEKESTDSAAGGTALATGYKTYNKVIGKDHEGNDVKNIREFAYENGANTAVLTSDALTGATPACFTAHVPNRGNTSLIESAQKSLLRSGELMIGEGYLTSNFLDRTINALNTISSNDATFFIMIEEAYIDKNADDNNKEGLMDIMARWNDVIAYVVEFTISHPGTILLITADHETGGIILDENNEYIFTTEEHTNVNVPIYAIGDGTNIFNDTATENTEVAKFMAKVFGNTQFGGELPIV